MVFLVCCCFSRPKACQISLFGLLYGVQCTPLIVCWLEHAHSFIDDKIIQIMLSDHLLMIQSPESRRVIKSFGRLRRDERFLYIIRITSIIVIGPFCSCKKSQWLKWNLKKYISGRMFGINTTQLLQVETLIGGII